MYPSKLRDRIDDYDSWFVYTKQSDKGSKHQEKLTQLGNGSNKHGYSVATEQTKYGTTSKHRGQKHRFPFGKGPDQLDRLEVTTIWQKATRQWKIHAPRWQGDYSNPTDGFHICQTTIPRWLRCFNNKAWCGWFYPMNGESETCTVDGWLLYPATILQQH